MRQMTLTCPEKYANAMKAAKAAVDLTALGIGGLRPKRTLTGALILEVPGLERMAKADTLTAEIAEALSGMKKVLGDMPS